MPQTDFIKLMVSHIVAAILTIGGLAAIIFVWMQPIPDGKEGVMALLGGFVGMGATFLFQTNTQGATRAQVRNDLLTAPQTDPSGPIDVE